MPLNDKEFPRNLLFLIDRDGIYSSVPQSEYTANGVKRCIRGFYFQPRARLTLAGAIKIRNYGCFILCEEKIPDNLIKQ